MMQSKFIDRVRFGVAGAVLLAAAASVCADEQQCIETSEDGRVIVDRCVDSDELPQAVAARAGFPFGLAPDWQNTIRRQVGALAVADIDGDGDNDLVVGCFNSSAFPPYDDWRNFIYRNVGGVLEANPSWISADQVHTGDIQVADFNNDGFADVFAANGGGAFTPSRIYFGLPANAGPSTTHGWQSSISPATWATFSAVTDIDNDGDIDIITTNQGVDPNPYRPVYMFRNNSGNVEVTPSWQSQEHSIQNGVDVVDLNGDGWKDVIVAKWVNFKTGVYMNVNGTPATAPAWESPTNSTDRSAAAADFDGDTRIDFLIGGSTTTTNPPRVYSQLTDGVYTPTWASAAASPSTQEVRSHDVNDDGWPDVTEVHFSTGRTHIYLNDAGTIPTLPTWTYDSPLVGNAVNYGDINGNGCADLVIGLSGEPSVLVFYHKCSGPICFGDIAPADGDGSVGVLDLLAIINGWGVCPLPPPDCLGDVAPEGGDGSVGVPDLLAIINSWGPCD